LFDGIEFRFSGTWIACYAKLSITANTIPAADDTAASMVDGGK
jgi:hypothetical protein